MPFSENLTELAQIDFSRAARILRPEQHGLFSLKSEML